MSPEVKARLLVWLLLLGASVVLSQLGVAFAGDLIGQQGPL
jgi:hypothetical protein